MMMEMVLHDTASVYGEDIGCSDDVDEILNHDFILNLREDRTTPPSYCS